MSGKLVTARSISCTETIESINQNIYKYSYMHERNFLKANPILRTTWKNYGRNLRLQNNNNINYVQIREVQNRTDTGKEQLVKQEMLNRDPTHNLTLFYEAQREEETPGVWGRQKVRTGRVEGGRRGKKGCAPERSSFCFVAWLACECYEDGILRDNRQLDYRLLAEVFVGPAVR